MKGLSTRQFEIMDILWEGGKTMTASQILAKDESLNINTVQASLRCLIKKGYIEMADIVYSGTVLTRSYLPLITREEYMKRLFMQDRTDNAKSRVSLIAALISEETDPEALEYVAKLAKEQKDKIKK